MSTTDRTDPSPLQMTFRWPVVRQCMAVMVVVGTILNMINQGDAILALDSVDRVKLM